MKRTSYLGCLIALLFAQFFITPVLAATKPLVLTPLLPTLSTNFSGGDEVQYLLTSPTEMLLIGTLDTTSSPLITATPLGGSDGFITAVDLHGDSYACLERPKSDGKARCHRHPLST